MKKVDKFPCEAMNKDTGQTAYVEGICDDCTYLTEMFNHKFCGYCPPRVGLHQTIRSQIKGCIWCENYTKKLDSKCCQDCMENEEYINKSIYDVYPELKGE